MIRKNLRRNYAIKIEGLRSDSSRREETRRGKETGRREKARGRLRKAHRKIRETQVRGSSRSSMNSSQKF